MAGIDFTTWSPYFIIAYILLKDVLPKLFPEIAKAISKRVSTEDRLFKVLEDNITADLALSQALIGLKDALATLDRRVINVENFIIAERKARLITE